MQIRELMAKMVQPRTSLTAGPVQVQVSSEEEESLFDGEVGRIETCLREAMRREASVWSDNATKSVINEINALVELLKSPILHADANLVIDTRRIRAMVHNQEIDTLRSIDSVILRSVRDISTGKSLLRRAALLSDPSLIDLLVTEKSCDMNAMCFEGQTPLHYAV